MENKPDQNTKPLLFDNLPPPPEKETFTALGFQKTEEEKDGNDA